MKDERVQLSRTGCYLELTQWESMDWKPELSLNYTEHACDHWSSDTQTDVSISPEEAKAMIALLQKFLAAFG